MIGISHHDRLQDAQIALALANGGGPPPPAANPFHIVAFSFATPSPLVLQPVAGGSHIVRAAILVTQIFDGGGPFCQLGAIASPALAPGAKMLSFKVSGARMIAI
jgi:hypothetical protein